MNKSGFSLIEILISMSILSIVAITNMMMFSNQQKSNNYVEFSLKRTQLQNLIISQVLNNSDNCRCLFTGADPFLSDPSSPGLTLEGVSPTKIGQYRFATPGDCTTATIPQPFIDTIGTDGLQTASI